MKIIQNKKNIQNCSQVSLAADGEDGNGLQLEKMRLNFSKFVSAHFQIIDINDRGLPSTFAN